MKRINNLQFIGKLNKAKIGNFGEEYGDIDPKSERVVFIGV